jgi:hypothetical protein
MNDPTYSLSELRGLISSLEESEFCRRYGGLYLLVMGILSVEEIESATSGEEDTLLLKFGRNPKHDLSQPHPLAGQVFYFAPAQLNWVFTFGRSEACDIIIPDESVSERHCQIQVLEDALLLSDLGSTNGTYVSQEPIPEGYPQTLKDGDLLTMGRYSFQLYSARTLHATMTALDILDRG